MGKNWTIEDLATLRPGMVKDSDRKMLEMSIVEKKDFTPQQATQALGRMKSGQMNKTEALYAKRLEAMKMTGDILWWAFEPVNLRLAKKCFYSVDFMVMLANGAVECHEIKGRWQDDALVKVKAAAAKFPFKFIAFQLVKGDWVTREF